jgi:hypothetical protein
MTEPKTQTERECVAENGNVDVCRCDNCGRELSTELSTLKEQLRLTNEMLAAADHIGGYLDIARGTTWSIHSDHDSGWHYSVDDKIVASGKSMLEAFAAIREQQGEK